MARQSRALSILLTRPLAQGDRFAAALKEAFGESVRVVVSPLLAPEFFTPSLTGAKYGAVILTSETGAEAARRILATGQTLPRRAWCVGDRTAEAARAAGFDALSAQGDAEALIAAIKAADEGGPFLHLRGREARGAIAQTLNSAGIETQEAICYAQEAQPLTPAARDLLGQTGAVIVPLFSPRTAQLFADALGESTPPSAPLLLVCLSPAVAEAAQSLPAERCILASHPDAASMLEAIGAFVTGPHA
jgi:uroporphyrinogen-III synthase